MKTPKKYIPRRSPDQARISISLSANVLIMLKNLAKSECRNVSKCVEYHMRQVLQRDHPDLAAALRDAEIKKD